MYDPKEHLEAGWPSAHILDMLCEVQPVVDFHVAHFRGFCERYDCMVSMLHHNHGIESENISLNKLILLRNLKCYQLSH